METVLIYQESYGRIKPAASFCPVIIFLIVLFSTLNRPSSATTPCDVCGKPLQDSPRPAVSLLFLCRHVAHATCVTSIENLSTPDYFVTGDGISASRGISGSIAL